VLIIRRSQDSTNTITYRLDAARMHAIFVESPTVHRAYQALVPDKVSTSLHCHVLPCLSTVLLAHATINGK
jgi:hypothetical protein